MEREGVLGFGASTRVQVETEEWLKIHTLRAAQLRAVLGPAPVSHDKASE